MANIVYISHFNLKGSGYLNLSFPLCKGLSERGHNLKVIGLEYRGEEHPYNFSLFPAQRMEELVGMIYNLHFLHSPDLYISAFDIPMQFKIFSNGIISKILPEMKIATIFPIESDPLTFSWASQLINFNYNFCISQAGTAECRKSGVEAEYIPLGTDRESWRKPLIGEKEMLRKSFGIGEDEFVILTVADNQERKNLSAALEIVGNLKKNNPNKKIRYLLVTRVDSTIGWVLSDLYQKYNLSQNMLTFERGIDFKTLWAFYAMSDVFLLPSKAEGYGMPVIEAMSVGVPVVATKCGAFIEHLSVGRGFLVDYNYVYLDPFGNSNRYFIDVKKAEIILKKIMLEEVKVDQDEVDKYIESRTWDKAIDILDKTIQKIVEDKNSKEKEIG